MGYAIARWRHAGLAYDAYASSSGVFPLSGAHSQPQDAQVGRFFAGRNLHVLCMHNAQKFPERKTTVNHEFDEWNESGEASGNNRGLLG
jgi:hypothetical protein